MPLMTTTTRHPFGGGYRNPGDTFEASDHEASVYATLGWASAGGKAADVKLAKVAKAAKTAKSAKPAKPATKAATYRTRAMKARK